jgi:ribose-phosphate pyrophosphokinase
MASLLEAPIVFGYKRRESADQIEALAVAGSVEGRDCVVVEDMITTGGTAATIANMLRAHGAQRVLFAATHGVLTAGSRERLLAAPIDEVIVTDSIPIGPEKRGKPITVLSVAPLLAEAIIRVHENRSVSELFR